MAVHPTEALIRKWRGRVVVSVIALVNRMRSVVFVFCGRRDFMSARVNIHKYLSSEPGRALLNLGKVTEPSGIEAPLLELVRVRTSQINGCAYCIDMHTKDARALGETEQRLYGLDAWREAPYYSERERAALEWTEAIAKVAETHVPDEAYDGIRQHFEESDIVALTFVAVATNAWNRLILSFRVPAGSYKTQPASA
jgi:AhpD family alkylhydroperoxidase